MEAPQEPQEEAWEEDLLLAEEPSPAPEEAPPAPEPLPLAPGPGGGRDRGGPRGPSPGPPHAPPRPPQAGGPRALEEAVALFHRVHGVPKTPLPFLLRAAERALAELEIPLRPLVGQVEGEEVRGLKPSPSFLALFREAGGEEGEGLLCFHGEEEVHTGRPSLFLSPEGLLAASGLEAPWRGSSWSGWPSTWKTPSSSWPRGASPPLPLPPPGDGLRGPYALEAGLEGPDLVPKPRRPLKVQSLRRLPHGKLQLGDPLPQVLPGEVGLEGPPRSPRGG